MGRLSAILALLVLGSSVAQPAEAQPSTAPPSAPEAHPEATAALPPPSLVEAAPRTDGYAAPRTAGYTASAAPAPSVSQTATSAPPSDEARARDAHVDRVLLLPTAETHPAGTVALSSYEIAIVQLTYAVSDSTQIAFSTTPPIEGIVPLDLSVKSTIARGQGYRLAVFGGVSGAIGLDDGPAWVGRVGMVGQACFDRNCRSSANLGATALLLGPATFVATGAGLVLRVSELFAVLAEVDTLVPSGRTVAEWHGIVGGAGFRWSGRRWAVDAALYTSLEFGHPVVPFLAASYRFLP